MKYEGDLYGRVGNKYLRLTMTAEDVDEMEQERNRLREAFNNLSALIGDKTPSSTEIDSACMWFRHDYGLMDKEDRDKLKFEAKEWLRAWKKVFGVI